MEIGEAGVHGLLAQRRVLPEVSREADNVTIQHHNMAATNAQGLDQRLVLVH